MGVERRKDMTFKKVQKGEEVTCIIEGRVDTQSSPDLQIEFERILDEDVKKFTLDFEKVNYLSSAGLRVILWLQKRVSAVHQHIRIAIIALRQNKANYAVIHPCPLRNSPD